MEKSSDEKAGTYATLVANSFRVYSPTDLPSTDTDPSVGFSNWFMHLTNVDFPTPLGPIMQTSPGSDNSRLIPWRILASSE